MTPEFLLLLSKTDYWLVLQINTQINNYYSDKELIIYPKNGEVVGILTD